MRWLLGIAGLSALGAATLMSVVNAGGIYAPMAPGIIAMAVILAVGSAAVSYAHAQGFSVIAVALGVCMLVSESGAGLMTARRVMENREAFRAPIAELATKRQAALAELTAAEAAKPAVPDGKRLNDAEAAKSAAEAAVREKAADKGCRENCRLLLQAAVDAAQREAEAARAEIEDFTRSESQRLENRRTAARAAWATLPPARSATPLSDETGVPEWAFDIWEALALSIGLNIPGSLLIGLAVSAPAVPCRRERKIGPTELGEAQRISPSLTAIGVRPTGAVAKFVLEKIEPSESGRVEVGDVYKAYRAWCQALSLDALPVESFGEALKGVIEQSEIEAIRSRGRVYLKGLAITA